MAERNTAVETDDPAGPPEPTWSVYLIRRADGGLYTGIATDVKRRLSEHRAGRGAKALRGRGPLRLAAHGRVGARGLAQRIEHRIKLLSKSEKERLVSARGAVRNLIRRETRAWASARDDAP